MLKFTLFLLLDNGLSFSGNFLAAVGSLIIRDAKVGDDMAQVLGQLYHVLLALSLIPTPFLIVVHFKLSCIQIRKCVSRVCGKCCKRRLAGSRQDPLTEMMFSSTC